MRKILFWLHVCLGVAGGIVILLMSVTGVLLAYERQITAWVDRDHRSVAPAAGAPRLTIEALLAKLPERPAQLTLRNDPAASAEAGYGREKTLFVNPYTGAVLGEASHDARAFFQKVESLHRWLGFEGENRQAARAVTGVCNFAFLGLVLSGPFLWWPKYWTRQNLKAITMFRRGIKGRARDWNWHNVIGIWSAAPLFIIVLTGVIMSYPWANNLLYRLTGNEPPVQRPRQSDREREGRRGRAEVPNNAGLDALWARAEQQVPNWNSISLRVPGSPKAPVAFQIDQGSGGRPDLRSTLTLDRRSGDVVQWETFAANNLGRRLRSWARFSHTGEAGGLTGQTIAALASLGAVFLVWTGIALALRRLRSWRERKRSVESELIHV